MKYLKHCNRFWQHFCPLIKHTRAYSLNICSLKFNLLLKKPNLNFENLNFWIKYVCLRHIQFSNNFSFLNFAISEHSKLEWGRPKFQSINCKGMGPFGVYKGTNILTKCVISNTVLYICCCFICHNVMPSSSFLGYNINELSTQITYQIL